MRTVLPGLLLVLLACACGPGTEGGRTYLVAHDRWVPLGDGNPWADENEAALACDPTGFREEPPLFEVETGLCDFVTFAQPALGAVRAGELLHAVGWHLPLFGSGDPDTEETGHLVVRAGDQVVLDYRTDIPAAETALSEYVEATEDIPAGTLVYFHVHNHGNNSWRLLEVSAGPADVFGDVL